MQKRERGSPREPGISRLNRIPVQECGEELVDLRVFCRGIFVKANPSLVRRSVAQMVQTAHDSLPPGFVLRINSAFRTYEMQARGYFNHLAKIKEKHPEWPHSIQRREANKFWHPPDQKAAPGHCTGGAVDVALQNPEGEAIDVTSTVREGIDSNPTFVHGLTATARANRQILIAAMSGAGFSNCADEWWHWSYGDMGWAGRLGFDCAIFDAISATEEEIARATIVEPPAEAVCECDSV